MFLDTTKQAYDFNEYAVRKEQLKKMIQDNFGTPIKGKIVLFAAFETDRHVFAQESSFYYITGIQEPGSVLVMDLDSDQSTLYIPHYATSRAAWIHNPIHEKSDQSQLFDIKKVALLGNPCPGYQFHPFFEPDHYVHFMHYIASVIEQGESIFTLYPNNAHEYVEQRSIIERLKKYMPELEPALVDISPLLAQLRRKKSMRELEHMYKAIEITLLAHNAASQAIEHEMTEAEVQASLEYMMIAANAKPAFPSIVGSGKNSTVLHYNANAGTMRNGDLVVVDIGAQYNYYCADITRTYPVSGHFTKRQREVYNIVLDTQEYIANIAKPGMWLNNKNYPEQSLNHLARAYLKERGYDHYFVHGIGHYLGMDVHDVGDYAAPLQPGDIFTIEPGIYIPQESIGIRIEDNYWVVEDQVICLSEGLPKTVEQIEECMQEVDDNDDISTDVDFVDFA